MISKFMNVARSKDVRSLFKIVVALITVVKAINDLTEEDDIVIIVD